MAEEVAKAKAEAEAKAAVERAAAEKGTHFTAFISKLTTDKCQNSSFTCFVSICSG